MNENKIILDLCGGTGSWSAPYKKAGYNVRLITLPDFDVTNWKSYPEIIEPVLCGGVYGILAAPPCEQFSYARTKAKTPRDLNKGMDTVRACLEIIWSCQERQQDTRFKTTSLKFWALENPYHGLLKHFLGRPPYIFSPFDFGHNYKKRTALWGNFNFPAKTPGAECSNVKFDKMRSSDIHPEYFGKLDRKARRAITPSGFAQAFYKANR